MTLLFFCVSGAVVIQVFAAANNAMLRNQRTDNAVLCAQSCAESYSVSCDLGRSIKTVFGKEYTPENGVYTLTLNEELLPESNADIKLVFTEQTESTSVGKLSTVTAVFSSGDEEFYRLSFSAYSPNHGGDANE